jgi:hypothetical protein
MVALVAVVHTAKELSKDFVKTMKCHNYRTDPFRILVKYGETLDQEIVRVLQQIVEMTSH